MGGIGGAIMGRVSSARQAASGGGGGGGTELPPREEAELPPPMQRRQPSPLNGLLMDDDPQAELPGRIAPRQMRV